MQDEYCCGRGSNPLPCKYMEGCEAREDVTSTDDYHTRYKAFYASEVCLRDDLSLGSPELEPILKQLKQELEKSGVGLMCRGSSYEHLGHDETVVLDFSKRDEAHFNEVKALQDHIKCLREELEEIQNNHKKRISASPIEAATFLMNDDWFYEKRYDGAVATRKLNKSELRQIAEHLLVYCNNNSDGDQ